MDNLPYIGEMFALAAPLCWAFAVILFRKTGETVPALALNLFKNILAMVLFVATLVALRPIPEQSVPGWHYLLLIVSGAIGIGVSDTLFFATLNRVGAGLQAIIDTSYSPFIIFLSFLFLDEHLTAPQLFGVALILSAVLSVGWMGGPKGSLPRRTIATGVMLGVAATFTQAVSIVMIKPILGDYPVIWANCWRLLGGLVASVLLLPLLPQRRRALATLRDLRVWPVMVPAAVIGTYISLLFWLGGMKYTLASIAAALNQTATLWTFLLAVLLLKEPASWRRIAGLFIGLGGVALVTFG